MGREAPTKDHPHKWYAMGVFDVSHAFCFFCLGADEPAGVEEADLIGATTQRFFGSHHGETQRYTWYPGGICLG